MLILNSPFAAEKNGRRVLAPSSHDVFSHRSM
jgi:hypothetical protein